MKWTSAQLGELFPAVAAQMRGPLSNLALAMQDLAPEERREESPELDRKAARMEQSYYALLRFVENISNIGWLTGRRIPRRRRCELVRLVTDICVDSVDYMEEQGRVMTFSVPPAERVYQADPEALGTALFHLLSNALKFTPSGGWIRVELHTGGPGFRLSVSNSGEGLATKFLNFLSDRCENPDRLVTPPHGLGLGLPLCRAIAEAHGGRMLVESRPGFGCRVTLSIPDGKDFSVLDSAPVEYSAGFDRALLGLADALPSMSFRRSGPGSGTD